MQRCTFEPSGEPHVLHNMCKKSHAEVECGLLTIVQTQITHTCLLDLFPSKETECCENTFSLKT